MRNRYVFKFSGDLKFCFVIFFTHIEEGNSVNTFRKWKETAFAKTYCNRMKSNLDKLAQNRTSVGNGLKRP